MKKKTELIVYAVLIVAIISVYAFLIVNAEGNKLTLVLQLVCGIIVLFTCKKGLNIMMNQLDEENKQKLTWKKLMMFDAVLVIVGVLLVISKMIENYRGYGAAGARFHSGINIYVGIYYIVILIMAVICTVKVFYGIFKSQYSYEKKIISIDGKNMPINVFVRKNYKGEILTVEAECEISGEKLVAKGVDENEAVENLKRMLSN